MVETLVVKSSSLGINACTALTPARLDVLKLIGLDAHSDTVVHALGPIDRGRAELGQRGQQGLLGRLDLGQLGLGRLRRNGRRAGVQRSRVNDGGRLVSQLNDNLDIAVDVFLQIGILDILLVNDGRSGRHHINVATLFHRGGRLNRRNGRDGCCCYGFTHRQRCRRDGELKHHAHDDA